MLFIKLKECLFNGPQVTMLKPFLIKCFKSLVKGRFVNVKKLLNYPCYLFIKIHLDGHMGIIFPKPNGTLV
jgi:hypothetical protein